MPNRFLYLSVSVLIVALGAFATVTVGFLEPHETFVDGVTKAAFGIAIAFSGFLNIALIRSGGDSVIRVSCFFSNIVLAALLGIGGYLNAQSPLPFV